MGALGNEVDIEIKAPSLPLGSGRTLRARAALSPGGGLPQRLSFWPDCY
jgi:hypothetical protein